jgi:hypothetical protein
MNSSGECGTSAGTGVDRFGGLLLNEVETGVQVLSRRLRGSSLLSAEGWQRQGVSERPPTQARATSPHCEVAGSCRCARSHFGGIVTWCGVDVDPAVGQAYFL